MPTFVLGLHPGVPESDMMNVIVGMDAGHHTAGWRLERMDEPAACVGRVFAFGRRNGGFVVNQHGLVAVTDFDGLCRFQQGK